MTKSFLTFLAVTIGVYLLVAPALGIAAFLRKTARDRDLKTLREQVAELVRRIETLETAGKEAPPGPEATAAEDLEATAPESSAPEPEAPEPDAPQAAPEPQADQAGWPPPRTPAPPSGTAPPPPPGALPTKGGLEQWLTSRGLIWLGGGTLALAGIFLAKYTYDRGWLNLGPGARVTLGFLFGLALICAGEWLRRRPLQRAIAAIGPNYLPPALTAAGLFSAFGSLYAAYGLYGLLSPLLAFVLMAGVAFAAFGLAFLQGPLIAALALLGGFATPVLISTSDPSAWGLFGYLLVLTGTALAIVRILAWWWLAWGALIGAALWPLVWFAGAWSSGDATPLGAYLVLMCGAFLAVRHGQGASLELVAWRTWFGPLSRPDRIAWAAAGIIAGLIFILVRMDGYGLKSLLALFAFAGLILVAGYREAVFDAMAPGAAALVVALLALWHLPQIGAWPEMTHAFQGQGYGSATAPVIPPALTTFVAVCLVFSLLFGLSGFLFLARTRRPPLWAGLSVATPIVVLAVAYWRITDLGVDLRWSMTALALAAVYLAAAAWLRYRPLPRHGTLILGLYGIGVVAALSLGMTMALERAWLTVALALQLPAIALICDRLELPALRRIALVVAGTVLVRLVLNYNVLDYPMQGPRGFSWVLYGYGVPALAFWWAAKRFKRTADDRLVTVLEAGTLLLVWMLVTLEIRTLMAGSLTARSYLLSESAVQSVAWLGLAYGWLLAYRRNGRPMLLWAWRLLAGLAALHSPLVQVLALNPLESSEAVGGWPLFNLLGLAYLVPAVFAYLFAKELFRTGHRKLAGAALGYGLVLIFVYLSLEVRRAFHGPVLSVGPLSDPEYLTYSLVWLAYAWALLGAGLFSGLASARYASLAVLGIAACKVLFLDWGELVGLLRFISFAVLGFSLLGIPFLYQRYVFPPRPAGGPPAEDPAPAGGTT